MAELNTDNTIILYDIYDYNVVPIEVIMQINENYTACINRASDTPIKIYNKRLLELYTNKRSAYEALRELLVAKLQETLGNINEL
ncbi:hypothetical protein MA9V2_267 [Chryseobacterium phage MA9V-2]|nr:hypothetical protein MA9V2_267 [Chryseobacterium phage MA9V-2]